MTYPLLAIITFTLSWLLIKTLRHHLQNHLIDIPNQRSSHTNPTPSAGGLGFATAFALTLPLAPQPTIPPTLWLSLIPLTLISLLDDWREIPMGLRFIIHIATATAIVHQCGPLPTPWLSPPLTYGLTILTVTALINFYNFMDGLDGILAGVTTIQLSFLALWNHLPILWLAVASLLGFLRWNWAPAKIFMGDTGSTLLGALIAIALLYPHQTPTHAWHTLPILLPLMGDATYTLIRRLCQGKNILQAHRTHISQRLQRSGWSHSTVATTYILATTTIALSLWCIPTAPLFILSSAPFAIILCEIYFSRRLTDPDTPAQPTKPNLPSPTT